MAQADSESTTPHTFLRGSEVHDDVDLPTPPIAALATGEVVLSGPIAPDPIFSAIESHKRELDRRNQTIEAICAAEDRYRSEERDAWHRYEEASVTLLTTKPTTVAGVIALLNYVALPECSGPRLCETILDGSRLSSNRESATAAERFPALSAAALREITGEPR